MVIYLFKSDRDGIEYTNFDAFSDADHVQPDIVPPQSKLPVSEGVTQADFAVDEQDPAELAQSYIEQKKYPQAVGVLNKAIEKRGERSDLYLMLLGIYAIERDTEGFEKVANQLSNVTDDGNVLSQVMQLREVLDEQLANNAAVVSDMGNAQPTETQPVSNMDLDGFDTFDFDAPASDTAETTNITAQAEDDYFDFSGGDKDFEFTPTPTKDEVSTSKQDLVQETTLAVDKVTSEKVESEVTDVLADDTSASFDFDDWDTPAKEQIDTTTTVTTDGADVFEQNVFDEEVFAQEETALTDVAEDSDVIADVLVEDVTASDRVVDEASLAEKALAEDSEEADIFADFDFDAEPTSAIKTADDQANDSFDDLLADDIDMFDTPATPLVADEQVAESTNVSAPSKNLDTEQKVDSTASDDDIFDVEFDFEEEIAVETSNEHVNVTADTQIDDDVFSADFSAEPQTTIEPIEPTVTEAQSDRVNVAESNDEDLFDFEEHPTQQDSDFEDTKVFVDLDHEETTIQQVSAPHTATDDAEDVFDFDSTFTPDADTSVDTMDEKLTLTQPSKAVDLVSDQPKEEHFVDDVFDFDVEPLVATDVDVPVTETQVATDGEDAITESMTVSANNVSGTDDTVFDLDFNDDDVAVPETPAVEMATPESPALENEVLDIGQKDVEIDLETESSNLVLPTGNVQVSEPVIDDSIADINVSETLDDDTFSFDDVSDGNNTVNEVDTLVSTKPLSVEENLTEPVKVEQASIGPATSVNEQDNFVGAGFEDTISQLDALYSLQTEQNVPTAASKASNEQLNSVQTQTVNTDDALLTKNLGDSASQVATLAEMTTDTLEKSDLSDAIIDGSTVTATQTTNTLTGELVTDGELDVVEEITPNTSVVEEDDFSVDIDEDLSADMQANVEIEQQQVQEQQEPHEVAEQSAMQPTQPVVEEIPAQIPADEPVLDLSTLDKTFDFIKNIDEQQTTLELAGQYVTLGEYDSAKRLLQEVMSTGNSDQKQQAQTLLARIN